MTRAKAGRILRYLRPYLFLEFAISLIMVLTVVLGLIDPLVLKIVIDDVLVDRNTALLDVLVAALIGLFLLRVVLNVLTNYLFQFVGQRILFDIRFQLFEHLEKLHLDFFNHTKTGEIMSRVNNDVEKLQGVVTSTFIAIITDFVTVVAVLIVIFYLDWKLTLLALTLFPFLFISQLHLGRRVKQKSRETREKSAEILSFFQETISGIKLVQSFVKEKFEARRLIKKSRELINLRIRLGVLGGLTASLAGFMAAMGPMLVLWYGGHQVIRGAFTIGGLVAFYAYVSRMFSPVLRLAQHNVTIQTAMASIDRIFEYLDIEPQIKDSPDSRALKELEGGIVFSNIGFSYNNDEPIFKDLSFEVNPGEKVGVVGRSGVGKSTIVSLLCRFFDPQKGAVFLDGSDIREVKLASLRKHIGLVSQETILFNATIMENIRYGDTRASDEQIIKAAERAHIHDFIVSLPDKYNTLIGDRGVRLSGGERQRLSIARTILKDPGILIFDEATSSLDSRSERLIQESLEPLMRNRTTVVIAHRLSTIVNMDRIFVLHDGRLVESGKHEELLAKDGVYKMLWDEMAKKNGRS